MLGPKALRHQHLDELAKELRALVPEQSLGLGVHEDDASGVVHDHDRVRRRLQETAKLRLGALSIRDVADRAGHKDAVVGLERTQADLDRKLGAVLATASQLQPRTHRPHAGICEVVDAVLRMATSKPFGDEDLHVLAEKLGTCVAEEPLGLRVDANDLALAVDDDDRIGCGFEEILEQNV